MTRYLAAAGLLLSLCTPAWADEPCNDNFTSDGNLFTGRTYKTWAVLPGISRASAMSHAQAFTAENGFTVISADREGGSISAAQSNTQASGRGAPLNLSFRDEAGGTRITLSFATGAGQMAPEASIKRHFCLTVAAAAQSDPVGSAQTATSQARPSVASAAPTPRGYAAISPAQTQAIERAFEKPVVAPKLRALVEQAAPAIAAFVARISCLAEPAGQGSLNEFAAPGKDLTYLFAIRPMFTAPYHNKASCMTVVRAQGFSAPANNALKFEVVYKADDSGESAKLAHEAVRQPDGQWLFTQ